MNSALASKALSNPSSKLSGEGKVLIADLRDVIEKAKVLFLSKNDGNLLQDFAWQCQNVATDNVSKPGLPVDKDTAKQHGNEALDGLRTLGTLLITNGQFRKLCKSSIHLSHRRMFWLLTCPLVDDAIVLARDIAGDGASKVAAKVNPPEEKLNQIDQPAEDNTWHEVPDFKGMKDNALSKVQKNKPAVKDALKSAANDAQAAGEGQPTNQDAAASAASAATSNLQNQADANISDEQKDQAKEQVDKAQSKINQNLDKTKDYLKEKMPKERREQTIWRLKKMIVEIQGHEDCRHRLSTAAETHPADTLGQTNVPLIPCCVSQKLTQATQRP